MKKSIAILFALFALAASKTAFATEGKTYTVTIYVEHILHYYDPETGEEVGAKDSGVTTETVTVYAETEYEAERKAINQCQAMCSNSGTYQGKEYYAGRTCNVYRQRRISKASVQ